MPRCSASGRAPASTATGSITTEATRCTGPRRRISSSCSDTSVPPGLWTSTSVPTSPQLCAAAAAAGSRCHRPGSRRRPRSNTRSSRWSGSSPEAMNSTLMPPSYTVWSWRPIPTTSRSSRSGPNITRWGLPMSTVAHPPVEELLGLVRPEHGPAQPDGRLGGVDVLALEVVTVLIPAAVATVKVGGKRSALRTAAWARQRMPLPLISASPPSAFCRTIVRSATPRPSWTRITPSAPTPKRRSHRARTRSTGSGPLPSGSIWTRKSLPAPWCLVNRRRPASGGVVVMVIPDSLSSVRLARVPVDPSRSRPAPARPGGRRPPPSPPGRPRVQPLDPGVAPEPGPLAPGEGPGAPDRLVDRLGQRHAVLHVGSSSR